MATQEGTMQYILDQLVTIDTISARKMFGEYALYCDGKVVGLICDDTLFIKITEEGKTFVGDLYKEGCAYRGTKPSMQIDEDQIDHREWLEKLILLTAKNLPSPKPKTLKKI